MARVWVLNMYSIVTDHRQIASGTVRSCTGAHSHSFLLSGSDGLHT